jgi:hypothetical protein
MFSPRQGSPEAKGFKVGQRVTMLVECIGNDHEDNEHRVKPGSDGLVEAIEHFAPPQGLTFTIWIPVNELEGRGIANVFDESDGPITTFIKAKETP